VSRVLKEEESSFMPNWLSHKSGLRYRGLRFAFLFKGTKKWNFFIAFSQSHSGAELSAAGRLNLGWVIEDIWGLTNGAE